MQRFRLGSDDSGHDYLYPVEHEAEWQAWRDIPEDDERSWEAPAFARRIDGVSSITFTDPQED